MIITVLCSLSLTAQLVEHCIVIAKVNNNNYLIKLTDTMIALQVVTNLGGQLMSDIHNCTHLVTNKVKGEMFKNNQFLL